MKSWLFKLFVGKNAASLGRGLEQLLAGVILASVLFAASSLTVIPSPDLVGGWSVFVEALFGIGWQIRGRGTRLLFLQPWLYRRR